MDNLTHSLLGAVLARTGINNGLVAAAGGANLRARPLDENQLRSTVTTCLIVAANLPDIDVVTLPSRLLYMEHHRGYSHTYWGIVLLALLLPIPFIVWNQAIRDLPVRQARKYLYLFAVSLLGTSSHLFLDFTNSYGIRPYRPFSQHWIYGDFIPIVDPWIYLILGGALFLTTSGVKRYSMLWALGLSAVSLLMLIYGHGPEPNPIRVPRLVWFSLLLVVLVAKRIWRPRLQALSKSLMFSSLVLLAGYYFFCLQLHRMALKELRLQVTSRQENAYAVQRVAAMAVPGNPFCWTFLLDASDRYFSGQIYLPGGSVHYRPTVVKNLAGVPYRQAMQTCSGKVLMRFARFPFLELEQSHNGYVVYLRDLRFNVPSRPIGFGSTSIYFDDQWREPPEWRPACPWSEAF